MADKATTAIDPIPSGHRLMNAAKAAGWGYAAGLAQVAGASFMGPDFGPAIAGAALGAVVGGQTGTLIAFTSAVNSSWSSYRGG